MKQFFNKKANDFVRISYYYSYNLYDVDVFLYFPFWNTKSIKNVIPLQLDFWFIILIFIFKLYEYINNNFYWIQSELYELVLNLSSSYQDWIVFESYSVNYKNDLIFLYIITSFSLSNSTYTSTTPWAFCR